MTQFTPNEIQQILNHGLTPDIVNTQLSNFQSGFPFANIIRPATIGDGIMPALGVEYEKYYDDHKNNYKIVKFVPASGAATRMFRDLFEYLSTGTMNATTQTVLDNLPKFAFWSDLQKILPPNATNHDIIEHLVSEHGLNYGNLPKALLQFHKYPDSDRTALAEHLAEGAQYAQSNGHVNLHFTVSPEHIDGFNKLLAKILPLYESKLGVKYDISMSTQMPQTDTIAVNLDNTPFKNDDGTLLFRPAGHGALIENLNTIDGDIIFIKNIDNVCPEHARHDTITHKKRLAGLAIKIQSQIFNYLHALDNKTANIDEIRTFINSTLGIKISDNTDIRTILNRPLRVCGIIKNTGEPGGGPFWVRNNDDTASLQIVEPGQIASENISILQDGEFFSPTDLVCMTRDYLGQQFNLNDFVDSTAGFISEKSKNGRPLRAMERPGLWNGAMSNWNTIFVPVPNTTFTPVKVITDLIKPTHQ